MGPETLAGISLGTTALGALTGAAGAKKQQDAQQLQLQYQLAGMDASEEQMAAQEAAARYQQGVAFRNQELSRMLAQSELDKGTVEEQTARMAGAQRYASTVTGQAASGLDLASGSFGDVRRSTKMLNELDALTIRSNAAKSAWGYQQQGVGFGDEAALLGLQAESAQRGRGRIEQGKSILAGSKGNIAALGNLGIASSLLGGASSLGDKWMKYQQSGVF